MLGEKIRLLRKEKGLSQEELAIRLHVVRQTVSKWEKELSVPDAVLLQQMAEVFEVPVSELLNGEIPDGADKAGEPDRNEIALQLSRINEHLAIRNRRMGLMIRFFLILMIGTIVLIAILTALYVYRPGSFEEDVSSSVISVGDVSDENEEIAP